MLLFVQVKRWVAVTFWIIMGGGGNYAADRKSMASGKSYHLQQARHHFPLASREQPGLTSPVQPSSRLVLLEEPARTCSYRLSCREPPRWLLRAPASQTIVGIIVLTGSFLNEL